MQIKVVQLYIAVTKPVKSSGPSNKVQSLYVINDKSVQKSMQYFKTDAMLTNPYIK